MCLRTKCEAGQTESLRPTLEVDGVSRTIRSPLRNNRIMLSSSSIVMEAYGTGSDESWPTFLQSGEPQKPMPLPWTVFFLNGFDWKPDSGRLASMHRSIRNSELLIAEDKSPVIGFIHYVIHEDIIDGGLNSFITAFYVTPAYRGKGAGLFSWLNRLQTL